MKYLFIILILLTVGCQDSSYILPLEIEEAKEKCELHGELNRIVVHKEWFIPDARHMLYAEAVCNDKTSYQVKHSKK